MMRRITAIFITLCLLICLTACSHEAEGVFGVSESNASENVQVAQDAEQNIAQQASPDDTVAISPMPVASGTAVSEAAIEADDIVEDITEKVYASLEEKLISEFLKSHEEIVTEYAKQQATLGTAEDDPNSDAFDVDSMSLADVEFLNIYMQGTSHWSVAFIQQRLMDLGFMDSAEPTQYYGSITTEAVKQFQRQNELKQDGIMGEETIAMLINDDAKRYTAKLGMEGSDIKRIQTRLYELGYLPTKSLIDGNFGDETDKAVKAMQTANGLASDGKVGQMTVELLYSDDVVANLLSFGDKGEVILACQKRLKELGYLTTTPDGEYGNDTLAAVKLFQSRNDLVVDGYLGPTTRDVLDSSSAVANGLVIGDEGDTVKRVQQLLIKYGYMNSGSDTGYFGEVTNSAVIKFQKNNGLSADGNVGAKTMAKLTSGNAVSAGGSGGGTGAVDTGEARSGSVEELLKVALSKLGCKYVYGAKGPNQFDCSGFVYWCLNQVGVKQSYITSYGWRTVGKYKKITSYSSLQAGDIIVVTGHVGIIGENGTVIDASSSRGQIMHRNLSSWWSSRFICGWRIFD